VQPRICICCGEPIAQGSNKLSRNPNICASCSSMADGAADTPCGELERLHSQESAPQPPEAAPDEKVLEWDPKSEAVHSK
jgi:hypothetical protein